MTKVVGPKISRIKMEFIIKHNIYRNMRNNIHSLIYKMQQIANYIIRQTKIKSISLFFRTLYIPIRSVSEAGKKIKIHENILTMTFCFLFQTFSNRIFLIYTYNILSLIFII